MSLSRIDLLEICFHNISGLSLDRAAMLTEYLLFQHGLVSVRLSKLNLNREDIVQNLARLVV